jgi:hypothetical protein
MILSPYIDPHVRLIRIFDPNQEARIFWRRARRKAGNKRRRGTPRGNRAAPLAVTSLYFTTSTYIVLLPPRSALIHIGVLHVVARFVCRSRKEAKSPHLCSAQLCVAEKPH